MGTSAVRKKVGSGNLLGELKNELQLLLSETAAHAALPGEFDLSAGLDFRTAVAEYERSLIVDAMRAAKGQKKRAARLLNMSPSTLHGKINALRINTEQFT